MKARARERLGSRRPFMVRAGSVITRVAVLALACTFWTTTAAPALAAPKRLPPGKVHGTFHFECEGDVWFSGGKPLYPVTIALTRVPPALMPIGLPGVV